MTASDSETWMTKLKLGHGDILTIELPGLAAVSINTAARTIAIDGISGTADGAPLDEYRIADLRDGTYGDFHRLTPADTCFDADCRRSGQHDVNWTHAADAQGPAADVKPRDGEPGFYDATCGSCGEEFTTNFRIEHIDCPECEARRCPNCRTWFGSQS